MDRNSAWRVSPSYDLTFSSGPNGEHCSEVKSSVSKWSNFDTDANVSSSSSKLINSTITKIIKDNFYSVSLYC